MGREGAMRRRSELNRVPALLVAALLMIAVPSAATPPQTAYHALEERAAKDGAAAVRKVYHRDVNAILASLERSPESPSLKESFQRTMTVSWLFQYLRSWALAEGRDIRLRKASGEEVTKSAVVPMTDIAETAMGLGNAELQKFERMRVKAAPGELKNLGLTGSPEPSVAMNRDAMLRQLALLAKLAGAREQLERVFRMAPTKIDSSATAEEFMKRPHDFDSLLGLPKAGQRQGSLTEEEKVAIRQLVESFWQAVIRHDAASVARLYLDPSAARPLTDRMKDMELMSVDLSQADFRFERTGPDLVRVRVDNVSAVKMKKSQRASTTGGKSFLVVFRNGQALIAGLGGAR